MTDDQTQDPTTIVYAYAKDGSTTGPAPADPDRGPYVEIPVQGVAPEISQGLPRHAEATWPEDLGAILDSDRLYRDGQSFVDHLAESAYQTREIPVVDREPIVRAAQLTPGSRVKVARALDTVDELLDLCLGYLDAQHVAATADALREIRTRLHDLRSTDDQLLLPRDGT